MFSELLIQYPIPGEDRPGRVVPDHFAVLHPGPLDVYWSFATPLQPVGPFLTIDWLAENNPRKDYEGYRERYARALRVPYALVFSTDEQKATLFQLVGARYESVPPNPAGRLAVPALDLEAGLLDGRLRFWFRGELVRRPRELVGEIGVLRRETAGVRREVEQEQDATARRAALEVELARLREELRARPGG